MVRYGTVWYGTVRYDTVRYGTVWYSLFAFSWTYIQVILENNVTEQNYENEAGSDSMFPLPHFAYREEAGLHRIGEQDLVSLTLTLTFASPLFFLNATTFRKPHFFGYHFVCTKICVSN